MFGEKSTSESYFKSTTTAMFINLTNLIGNGRESGNGWKSWLKYIQQHEMDLQLSKEAIVYQRGSIAACSPGFRLTSADIKALKDCFENRSADMIRFQDSTYAVKSVTERQLVAFRGHHYLIVSRTSKMFVIAVCESRQLYELACGWIQKIGGKLEEKNF